MAARLTGDVETRAGDFPLQWRGGRTATGGGRVNEAADWLMRSGADGRILADFALIAAATDADGGPKYAFHAVCAPLARFIAGRAAGPNRDSALFELCHLIDAVDAAGRNPDRAWLFFVGQERVSASSCRALLEGAVEAEGWSRPGYELLPDGVKLDYADGGFELHVARMPFLVALYEFLLSMDEFGFAEEFLAVSARMSGSGQGRRAVQEASNAIGRHLRQYRRAHLAHSRHELAFDTILAFTRDGETAAFDDETIFAFWREHNQGDFRLYAATFDAFVAFARQMTVNGLSRASEAAARLGGEQTTGEVEPADEGQSVFDDGEWESPLPLLDQEPASRIRFLLNRSERRPLEGLMRTGPYAQRLPLAFLRREVFGAVQSAITTDLQTRREERWLRDRLSCSAAESYTEWRQRFVELSKRLERLQRATLHALLVGGAALPEDGDLELDAEQRQALLAECAVAFRNTGRKGYEMASIRDEGHVEGFRVGAEVLRRTGVQVLAFLNAAQRLDGEAGVLDAQFLADRVTFSAEFTKLYGDRHAEL